jgi:hypothetical protein
MALSRSASFRRSWAYSPEFQEGWFGTCSPCHGVAYGRAAGQADRVRARVRDNLVSHLGFPKEQVDLALRDTSLEEALHHPYGDDGRGGSGLPRHSIACGQGGGQALVRYSHGKIPSCGHRHHAVGLADGEDALVGIDRRNNARFR